MLENMLLSELNIGDEFEGFYLLKEAALKTSSNGKPYLSGTVSDMSGSVEFKVWDYSGKIGSADAGKVIKLRGNMGEFRAARQLTVSRIRLALDTDLFDKSSLVPVAPIDPEERFKEVEDLIESLDDKDYKKIAQYMLEKHRDAFFSIPAAKSIHHAFVNGLLMHTSNMLRAADLLSDIYSEVIDRNLLITGTLLHDFAKEKEYSFSELGTVNDYSVPGQLLGHLVMGAMELKEVCESLNIPEEKSILLQHMILSHHGEPEHGAAVVPQCAEAELLYHIDSIDSRMEIYAETYAQLEPGLFSQRLFALDKKIYKHG